MKKYFAFFAITCTTLLQLSLKNGFTQPLQPPQYLNAITDVQVADPEELSSHLTPIHEGNPNLEWEGTRGKNWLLVVTLFNSVQSCSSLMQTNIDRDDCAKKLQNNIIDNRSPVWVTVAPELKNFCTKIPNNIDLKLRVHQLLGLPYDQREAVAEIWVNPIYLLRPSLDPEITDSETFLSFPKNFNSKNLHFPTYVSEDYQKWFIEQHNNRNYPFTGLGYTYDWGNPSNEVGLSEFVIWFAPSLQKALISEAQKTLISEAIKVKRISSLEDYCHFN